MPVCTGDVGAGAAARIAALPLEEEGDRRGSRPGAGEAVRVWPTSAVPVIVGGDTGDGAVPGSITGPAAAEVAETGPAAFDPVSRTRIVWPRSSVPRR